MTKSAIVGLSELVLVVRDVARSAAFYEAALGLSLERGAPEEGWAWYRLDDGDGSRPQRLALRQGSLMFEEASPNAPDRVWGSAHFAVQVPRARLEEARSRAEGAGAGLLGPARLSWMRAEAVYFYDPDGNLVELWSPDE